MVSWGRILAREGGTRVPPVQAFYSYSRLSQMWGVSVDTVQRWVSELRRTNPKLVYISYRLRNGYRREAAISAMTAQALQNRHFPNARMPEKRRRTNVPEHVREADKQRLLAQIAARAGPAVMLAGPAPTDRPMKRLVLPPMPSRYADAQKAARDATTRANARP
jgi:hypothetical protein